MFAYYASCQCFTLKLLMTDGVIAQVAKLVDDWGMVSFTPLDVTEEDRFAAPFERLQAVDPCAAS